MENKKIKLIVLIVLLFIAVITVLGFAYNQIEKKKQADLIQKKNKEIVEESKKTNTTNGIETLATMEDELSDNSIYCGTFQLVWNDLKNKVAKQDIVFEPQLEIAKKLNKELFKESDLNKNDYYKIVADIEKGLKEKIKQEIKAKFGEESKILDDFDLENDKGPGKFIYSMLKKEFEFEREFEKLEKGKFKNFENVEYFGVKKSNEPSEDSRIEVLYYNGENDFAVKLKTKQNEEIILCKNPEGKTFKSVYEKILENSKKYEGNKNFVNTDSLKVPELKFKEKKEFEELKNKEFATKDDGNYQIVKAIQFIDFKLDKKGGKLVSEAAVEVLRTAMQIEVKERKFEFDDTFAMFLKEAGDKNPYFAAKISDISKFNK